MEQQAAPEVQGYEDDEELGAEDVEDQGDAAMDEAEEEAALGPGSITNREREEQERRARCEHIFRDTCVSVDIHLVKAR